MFHYWMRTEKVGMNALQGEAPIVLLYTLPTSREDIAIRKLKTRAIRTD